MPEVIGYLEKYSGSQKPSSSSRRRLSAAFIFGQGSARTKWERRFFVLRDGSQVMSYYKSPEDASSSSKPAQGTITCQAARVHVDAQDDTVFAVVKGDRTVFLRAGDAATRRQWVDVIVAAGATEAAPSSIPGMPAGTQMQGMLMRQASTKATSGKWEKRFLTICEGQLMVYKAESDAMLSSRKPALTSTQLQGCQVDMLQPEGAERVTFVLSKGDQVRTLHTCASMSSPPQRWRGACSTPGTPPVPTAPWRHLGCPGANVEGVEPRGGHQVDRGALRPAYRPAVD